LIFEVRGHDVNVSLGDGEPLAKLLFYRMSENAKPNDDDRDYNDQILELSKYFDKWPDKQQIHKNSDGTVINKSKK
jgi:hypothetical protein